MKQLTRIITCAALLLFVTGICQAKNPTQSGALLEINGKVTVICESECPSQSVDLTVTDSQIHSGPLPCSVANSNCRKVPIGGLGGSNCTASDQIATNAYVYQGGAPTGCDSGDPFETTQGTGAYPFKATGQPGYQFDVSTIYCTTIRTAGETPCPQTDESGAACNTNNNVCIGGHNLLTDTGFVKVTNNGSTSFTGTISLTGTPIIVDTTTSCFPSSQGPLNDSIVFNSDGDKTAFLPGDSVYLALEPESSNCGGFTSGDTLVGDITPVFVGTTTKLLPFPLFPLGQSVTLFNGTRLNGVAAMRDVLRLVSATDCDANVSNGNSSGSEFFGGTPLPSSAKCAHVSNGKAAIISNECFDVSGNQFADCTGIDPSLATPPWIGLNSRYSDDADPKNPFYMIEHDSIDDPTNVIISNRPGCTTPPCGPAGGPHHLNGRETVGDQNFNCQVFPTFSITPSAHAGGFITVTGNIVGSCPEAASNGLLTFTFEGPLTHGDDEGEDDGGNEGACRQRRISIPHPLGKGLPQTGSPIVLPSPVNVRLRVPNQACVGTFKLSATIIAGSNTLYNSSATFTVF